MELWRPRTPAVRSVSLERARMSLSPWPMAWQVTYAVEDAGLRISDYTA